MKFKSAILILFITLTHSSSIFAQNSDSNIFIHWRTLSDGIEYCETDAPFKSIVNDSKLTLLKINPKKVEFKMLSATEYDSTRTAPEWSKDMNVDIVVNAGMYDLSKRLSNKGYMQNFKHFNNPTFLDGYGAMMSFNPKDSLNPPFKIFDLSCEKWDSVKTFYNSYSQSMRMLDCSGNPLTWNKKNQSCSMLLCAMDLQGNLYYVFTRSPYTHNEMIVFLQMLPFDLVNATYLEGGPETSLYINVNGFHFEKTGSYISNSYPNDNNDHFWKLPNVVGIKSKTTK